MGWLSRLTGKNEVAAPESARAAVKPPEKASWGSRLLSWIRGETASDVNMVLNNGGTAALTSESVFPVGGKILSAPESEQGRWSAKITKLLGEMRTTLKANPLKLGLLQEIYEGLVGSLGQDGQDAETVLNEVLAGHPVVTPDGTKISQPRELLTVLSEELKGQIRNLRCITDRNLTIVEMQTLSVCSNLLAKSERGLATRAQESEEKGLYIISLMRSYEAMLVSIQADPTQDHLVDRAAEVFAELTELDAPNLLIKLLPQPEYDRLFGCGLVSEEQGVMTLIHPETVAFDALHAVQSVSSVARDSSAGATEKSQGMSRIQKLMAAIDQHFADSRQAYEDASVSEAKWFSDCAVILSNYGLLGTALQQILFALSIEPQNTNYRELALDLLEVAAESGYSIDHANQELAVPLQNTQEELAPIRPDFVTQRVLNLLRYIADPNGFPDWTCIENALDSALEAFARKTGGEVVNYDSWTDLDGVFSGPGEDPSLFARYDDFATLEGHSGDGDVSSVEEIIAQLLADAEQKETTSLEPFKHQLSTEPISLDGTVLRPPEEFGPGVSAVGSEKGDVPVDFMIVADNSVAPGQHDGDGLLQVSTYPAERTASLENMTAYRHEAESVVIGDQSGIDFSNLEIGSPEALMRLDQEIDAIGAGLEEQKPTPRYSFPSDKMPEPPENRRKSGYPRKGDAAPPTTSQPSLSIEERVTGNDPNKTKPYQISFNEPVIGAMLVAQPALGRSGEVPDSSSRIMAAIKKAGLETAAAEEASKPRPNETSLGFGPDTLAADAFFADAWSDIYDALDGRDIEDSKNNGGIDSSSLFEPVTGQFALPPTSVTNLSPAKASSSRLQLGDLDDGWAEIAEATPPTDLKLPEIPIRQRLDANAAQIACVKQNLEAQRAKLDAFEQELASFGERFASLQAAINGIKTPVAVPQEVRELA